jgi:hypothetical protein
MGRVQRLEAPGYPKGESMNKALAMLAMLAGLSACHGGDDIGDNDRHPPHVAIDIMESAVAQASMGFVPAAGD